MSVSASNNYEVMVFVDHIKVVGDGGTDCQVDVNGIRSVSLGKRASLLSMSSDSLSTWRAH